MNKGLRNAGGPTCAGLVAVTHQDGKGRPETDDRAGPQTRQTIPSQPSSTSDA